MVTWDPFFNIIHIIELKGLNIMALKIKISEEKDIVIVNITGKVDSFTYDDLNKGFKQSMKQGRKKILLNMKNLKYIDSKGIGAVISLAKWIDRIGGVLKLAELRPEVKQVFKLLSFDQMLSIYDSAAEAINSF